MAKKKKSTRGRKPKAKAPEPKQVNYFWRQVFAFVLVVLALFILLGGFGWGGMLPTKLFDGTAWLFGFVAFFVPFILIFLAVHKFKNEENVIPFVKLLSSVLFLVFLSGMLHVFLEREEAPLAASKGTYGGQLGNLTSTSFLSILNSMTAFIVFFGLAWVSFMVMLGITPRRMLELLITPFVRPTKDTDLNDIKEAEKHHKLRVDAGVPIEHHSESEREKSPAKLTSFKNTATKLSPEEDHAALTSASDPDWQLPNIKLLNQKQDKADPGNVNERAEIISESLAHFNINVEMEGANVGPRVTQFTLKPSTGVKMSKIVGLSDNIAYDLAANSIRMEAPIPGKRAVGIEVPNITAATVRLSSIIKSSEMAAQKSKLAFAVGKDISGKPVVGDLAKMPHLLVAGQTGSGKSVMINTILASFLYRNSPADLKLILVDPKYVEMGTYNDIPHLLTPVVTEPEKCISALKWAVAEMERRLRTMAEVNASNIVEYNERKEGEGMPYIVIIIDELADLMMMAARDVEALIVRLTQKARAAGIHLILATQRPSVNVITGLIKANVPARIAFTVASQVDSRTIIDQMGAEKLLGMGDMLFYTTDMSKPRRVQGALIEKGEVVKVTEFIKEQRAPTYNDEVVSMPVQLNGKGGIVADMAGIGGSGDDDLWNDAVRVVIESGKASTSYLQRRLGIGYGRASRMIDDMEDRGIVGPANGSKPRQVLVSSLDEAGMVDSPVSDDPRDEFLTR
jgi:S-DNA-T family DNA segregation ATPase FtsK/SpoIIIE